MTSFSNGPLPPPQVPDQASLDAFVEGTAHGLDRLSGGETPTALCPALELLLQSHRVSQNASYLSIVRKALDRLEPSLQLADNIVLAHLYLRLRLVTGEPQFGLRAVELVEQVMSRLHDEPQQLFRSALTSDGSSGQEPVGPYLVGDNALAASVFLEASWVLARSDWALVAATTVDRLLELWDGQPLQHSYGSERQPGTLAQLSDYAHLIMACLDRYGHNPQSRYLDAAKALASSMVEASSSLPGRPVADTATALARLYHVSYDEDYKDRARHLLGALVNPLTTPDPSGAAYALAVQRLLSPPIEVTLEGSLGTSAMDRMLHAAATLPYPNVDIKVPQGGVEGAAPTGGAAAHICLETLCLAPISDPDALHPIVMQQLHEQGDPGIDDIPIITLPTLPS